MCSLEPVFRGVLMSRFYAALAFLLMATLSAMPEARALDNFVSIQISIFPPHGGAAYKQLLPDGVVIGQHLSGDVAPRVFESRATLPSSELREINQLISQLRLQESSKVIVNQRVGATYKRALIVIKGASPLEFKAEWDKPFKSVKVQKLWALIAKSPAGAW